MNGVATITLDGSSIGEPADFSSAFFHATASPIPHYGESVTARQELRLNQPGQTTRDN
jgi:hypothetical protein